MVPNARFDDGSAPQFMWLEGDRETYPEPAPKITAYTASLIPGHGGLRGQLKGVLTAKNYQLPNGNYAKIDVVANFVAGEGAFSCQPD